MSHICALLSSYSRVDSLHCCSCCWCSQWHYMPSGAGRSAGASPRRAQARKPLMRFTISRQCCWALRPGRASVHPGFRHTTQSLVYPSGRPPFWMTTTMKRRRTHPGGPTMSHVRMNSAARWPMPWTAWAGQGKRKWTLRRKVSPFSILSFLGNSGAWREMQGLGA